MDTKTTRPIFPWYKERLQTKYLKAPTNKISPTGVSPVIFHGTPNHSSTQKLRKSIPKEHACFSKQMIQKQIRREYVAALEEKLKQHPLAMYTHYKDHMTPELFDKVVSVLDPDMCVNISSTLPNPMANHAEEEEEEENYTEQSGRSGVKKGQKVKANQVSNHEDMKAAASKSKTSSKWFVHG